jgi:hypothetical protein
MDYLGSMGCVILHECPRTKDPLFTVNEVLLVAMERVAFFDYGTSADADARKMPLPPSIILMDTFIV